jgi:hypothetical protein
MPYCYELAQHGTTLATRSFGRELRSELVQQMDGHKHLELDFSGVLSASHSFVDELVARLAEDSKAGCIEFDVAISGAAPDVEAVIRRAVERREVQLAQAA